MAIVSLNTIKNWFKTGKKPTQGQFSDTFDSFYHKEEMLSTDDVHGLNGILNNKLDASQFDGHVADTDNPHHVTAEQLGLGGIDERLDAKLDKDDPQVHSHENIDVLNHIGDDDNDAPTWNGEPWPIGTYSKAEIDAGFVHNLSADKTVAATYNSEQNALTHQVDGHPVAVGKALDADTVDGRHASAFATSAQGAKADSAVQRAGDTMTGTLRTPTIELTATSGTQITVGRGSANYIVAPAGGYFTFIPNGRPTGNNQSPLIIEDGAVSAGSVTTLGKPGASWLTAYTNTLNLTSTAEEKHLSFSRGGVNYIAAPPGGQFAFLANGAGVGIANSAFVISDTIVYPGKTNVSLGYSTQPWANVYATKFTGDLTGNATSALRFKSYEGQSVIGGFPLSSMLSGGGVAGNYESPTYWANAPAGFDYGGVVQINSRDYSDLLSIQLAWDINHNSASSTRNLWFRTKNNLAWQNDWKQVADVAWADNRFALGTNGIANSAAKISVPLWQDANNAYQTSSGFYSYFNSSSVNFPSVAGAGLRLQRLAGADVSISQLLLDIHSNIGNDTDVYIRKSFGNGSGIAYGTWYKLINEGNISAYAIAKSANIPSNSDLNAYTTEGFYRCTLTASASTIANVPDIYAFALLVQQTSTNGCTQLYSRLGNISLGTRWYVRSYYNGSWSAWERLSTLADLSGYLPLTGGTVTGNLNINSKLVLNTNGQLYPSNGSSSNAGMYGNNVSAAQIKNIWGLHYANTIPADGSTFGTSFTGLAAIVAGSGGNTNYPQLDGAGGWQVVFTNTGSPKVGLQPRGVWVNGGFYKQGSSDSYVLLGGGGHKLLSEIGGAANGVWHSLKWTNEITHATITAHTSKLRIGANGNIEMKGYINVTLDSSGLYYLTCPIPSEILTYIRQNEGITSITLPVTPPLETIEAAGTLTLSTDIDNPGIAIAGMCVMGGSASKTITLPFTYILPV